jgi:Vitamin B6 photo-protection and homoeostasis
VNFPLSIPCQNYKLGLQNIDNMTVLQSIVGVAGGATRAALTEHQARRNNMADVSAKDGSQVMHNCVLSVLSFVYTDAFS